MTTFENCKNSPIYYISIPNPEIPTIIHVLQSHYKPTPTPPTSTSIPPHSLQHCQPLLCHRSVLPFPPRRRDGSPLRVVTQLIVHDKIHGSLCQTPFWILSLTVVDHVRDVLLEICQVASGAAFVRWMRLLYSWGVKLVTWWMS